MDGIGGVLTAVIPSVGVGVLFWYAMRAILNADRTERQAIARMDQAEARREEENRPEESTPGV